MKLLVIALISILLPHAKPIKKYVIEGLAQGTTYRVTYYAADSLVSRAEVEQVLNELDSSLSLYKPYSIINMFNRSANGITIDEHLKKVVERSLQVYEVTHGAFDITVWPLVNAWGFGVEKINSVPSQRLIDSIMSCVGSNKLQLRTSNTVRGSGHRSGNGMPEGSSVLQKQLPCVAIDVNGIAQGYSVDVLSELLEQKGISNYMVEIGGEIRMKGRKQPGNEPMKIGIESPAFKFLSESAGKPGGSLGDNPFAAPQLKTIVMPDSGAVTTSGSYRRFYESNGKRVTHIIDPRTGSTVQNELISVTVFAKDAMTADAYDNALMVMGLDEGLRFAKLNKIAAYFIYRGKNGLLTDAATEGFNKLVLASALSGRAGVR